MTRLCATSVTMLMLHNRQSLTSGSDVSVPKTSLHSLILRTIRPCSFTSSSTAFHPYFIGPRGIPGASHLAGGSRLGFCRDLLKRRSAQTIQFSSSFNVFTSYGSRTYKLESCCIIEPHRKTGSPRALPYTFTVEYRSF